MASLFLFPNNHATITPACQCSKSNGKLAPGYISQRAGARNNHATITPACQCSKSNGKQAPGPYFAARRRPQQSCNNHAGLPMRKAQWEMSSRAIFRSAPVPADKRPSRSRGFPIGSPRPADNHPVPCPRHGPVAMERWVRQQSAL